MLGNLISIVLPFSSLADFCRRWKIRELALFGSALRKDFKAESDVDLLATFSETSDWGLLDHVQMQQELQALLGRKVDLISKRALAQSQNPILPAEILNTAQVIYSEHEAADAKR
jgi:uncharacterized protein